MASQLRINRDPDDLTFENLYEGQPVTLFGIQLQVVHKSEYIVTLDGVTEDTQGKVIITRPQWPNVVKGSI